VFNAKKNPKKKFLTNWHVIFASKKMLSSLLTEYGETESVPEAADLVENWKDAVETLDETQGEMTSAEA